MKPRIPVMEIMSRNPVTARPSLSVDKAATVMRDRGVGSLVITERGQASGILTERDIVTKVAAANRKPSSVKVKDVMTSPVIAVHPHEGVEEAARKMSARRIRRLAVVEEGKLVGIVTENDILRIMPSLVELTRERARVGFEEAGTAEGHCDVCGVLTKDLVRDGKILVCQDHRAR